MKKKCYLIALFFLFAFLIVKPIKSDAAFKNVKGTYYFYAKNGQKVKGWMTYRRKRYYFDQKGVMQKGWQLINNNWYYFSKSRSNPGVMLKGWQNIGRKRFYFHAKTGVLHRGWIRSNKKLYFCNRYHGLLTGRRNIEGEYYFFDAKGAARTGWYTYNKKRYYLSKKNGAAIKGLAVISRKLYYFDYRGIMQKSRTVVVNGNTYKINSQGVCTLIANNKPGTPDDMLFFTLYESGNEGYGQVGGDRGNACGKYQFDRRYSLIPFVKYCYSRDPVVFADFKPYAGWTNTKKYQDKMKSNKTFYKAWTNIYNKYPVIFKNYQDSFAKQEYYDPVESQLRSWGIDITKRPYAVKGAVFSYSIQHGSYTAALAIRSAKINNATNNQDFIEALYKYRIKKFPAYRSRYTREMNDALSRLK